MAYTNLEISEEVLRKARSGEDLDAMLVHVVHTFVKNRHFINMFDALQEVTPAQWEKQVNKASADLLERLQTALDEVNAGLDNGDYLDACPKQ